VAKKASVSDDEVLKNGLLAIATADGPRRLTGKGAPPAVFGGTAADKRAIAICQADENPLVVATGSGKNPIVTLTAAGFGRIADTLPEEKVGAVAKGVAEGLPVAERIAFLQGVVARSPVATADLLPLLEAAVAAEKQEREAEAARLEKRRKAEAASLEALERWKAVLQARRQDEIAWVKRQMAALGVEPEVASRSKEPTVGPVTKDDYAFRRDVANQLASSWKATWDPDRPEVRDYLESAMWNVRGLTMIGEAGEQTSFNARYHEGGPGVFHDDPVRITRPGWKLEEGDDADYVALKAQVEKRG
jgi:hypothetical protein